MPNTVTIDLLPDVCVCSVCGGKSVFVRDVEMPRKGPKDDRKGAQ